MSSLCCLLLLVVRNVLFVIVGWWHVRALLLFGCLLCGAVWCCLLVVFAVCFLFILDVCSGWRLIVVD